ncbi:hypothetical protein R1flu_014602 [Riccia fluitans]|uniref:Uncharacterized protein n=1 Tax=Riccia fluitans TaxID=41844 RepID=A0ABD1YGY7_9MARC
MAGFIRKIFGHFGGKKEDHHHRKQPNNNQGQEQGHGVEQPAHNHQYHQPYQTTEQTTSPGGFGVKVAVPVEPSTRGPVVAQCTYGNGGVQGLKWYADKLRVDDDGDVAQEFLSEVIPETPGPYNKRRPPRFETTSYRTGRLHGSGHLASRRILQDLEIRDDHVLYGFAEKLVERKSMGPIC